ncbi:MAG TPA: glycosyltransferase [Candidatus Eisenbacteria bacterium]|nr:glycosyltransferase [Candidatus Eisenbacteria bacterium]
MSRPTTSIQPAPPLPAVVCPRCHKRLHRATPDRLNCEGGHAFPVFDGIPDLMPEAVLSEAPAVLTAALDLTVVLPAWNEADNLRVLLPRLRSVLAAVGARAEVLVVDKGSQDGTAAVAAGLGARVVRQTEPGLGGALRTGFAVARGRFICTMDADLQHDPQHLVAMWASRERAAVVIASRWTRGGRADMPLYRRLLSLLLNGVYSLVLGIPLTDLSTNFRLYRRDALQSVRFEGENYDVQQDLLVRLVNAGWDMVEVPQYHRRRLGGESHVQLLRFAIGYARTLVRLWRLRGAPEAADAEWRAYHSWNPARRVAEHRRVALLRATPAVRGECLYINCGSDPLLGMLPGAVGVDARMNRLRWARREGRALVRASLAALPFPDASFDAVVWSESRDRLADTERPLDELARVLAPGGSLILRVVHLGHRALVEALQAHGLAVESTRWLFGTQRVVRARKAAAGSGRAAGSAPARGSSGRQNSRHRSPGPSLEETQPLDGASAP